MKTSNVLTHTEYQERLKNLRTPEDAAAFAQELLAPMIAGMSRAPEPEEIPAVEEKSRPHQGRRSTIPELVSRQNPIASPWYEVTSSDNEAMVISLYAKGLTTRDISSYMKIHHGIELSQPGVSTITDKVFPLVKEWQSRPLSSCYPVMYLDGLHFKVRDGGKIVSKVAYIALGVNQYGMKEVMGIWISDSESAKFWLGVMNDMKNRGVDDVFIICVDGLKGFPEAIKAIYPQADVQVCVVHMIRHTVMFIPHKDREAFCKDLQLVYTAPSEEAGREALNEVSERWTQYRAYLKNWENRWEDIAPFFSYPAAIRRMIYTTNAIENLNRPLRMTSSYLPDWAECISSALLRIRRSLRTR